VATHPEIIITGIFEPDAEATLEVFVDNRGELLHLEPLLVVAANLIDVGDDMMKIVFTGMDDEVAGGHGSVLPKDTTEWGKISSKETA
jgi:hypothetical protein